MILAKPLLSAPFLNPRRLPIPTTIRLKSRTVSCFVASPHMQKAPRLRGLFCALVEQPNFIARIDGATAFDLGVDAHLGVAKMFL